MIVQYESELLNSVNTFKAWAAKHYPHITEENDNGEWEHYSTEYEEMVDRILRTIERVSPQNATAAMVDDILYGIARDDECSTIMELLRDYPEWFSLLCRECLKTEYRNAKWQFAADLGSYIGDDDLQKLIYDFLSTGEEYTERMALRTLADIDPAQAEIYAVQFWNRNKYENDEYQKMMAVEVLYQIGSDKLQHYLELSEQSAYPCLKALAKELSNELQAE